MNISRDPFGKTKDGKNIDVIRIENSQHYSFEVITYGAYLRSFKAPDSEGNISELTRNFESLSDYEDPINYMGATIGRYANRIANASFSLDEKTYHLQKNSGNCQLHGGTAGFNTKIWEAFPMREHDRASVKLTLTSPDGDQGFPGTVDASLTITLTENNELFFFYEAVTDKPTCISLTNHTYWNLRGSIEHGNIYDQEISITADKIVDVDEELIPTGKLTDVTNTPFDLHQMTPIGKHIAVPNNGLGFDNNFVLSAKKGLRKAAVVKDPKTGRTMEVHTDAPGLQFYSDNFSEPNHAAYCLEAGELPDAMNHSNFPSPVLRPGEMYRQITIHSFYTD
ncbi:MAG: galactose mutarotase [Bacteroidetes bacterium]|nr:galactose mutarotase [Bacteroidota bacterium]